MEHHLSIILLRMVKFLTAIIIQVPSSVEKAEFSFGSPCHFIILFYSVRSWITTENSFLSNISLKPCQIYIF